MGPDHPTLAVALLLLATQLVILATTLIKWRMEAQRAKQDRELQESQLRKLTRIERGQTPNPAKGPFVDYADADRPVTDHGLLLPGLRRKP